MSKYEFKGTPGEWCQSSESAEIIKRDFSDIGSDGGKLIASAMSYPGSSMYATEREAAYNAQAISAVPELIEALRDIVTRWDDSVPSDCVTEEHAKARSALAKATGERTGGE